ncbi:4'-phosphopantetheinyl transferase superfamily protein [Streptomyces sp. NPDC050625]|uniref:4'-phosphopantetheinyl transferase family protein n=1 Tax=Streptomyces sp. NPDC050625 TaxID=3154629 RepID=UPI003444B5B7
MTAPDRVMLRLAASDVPLPVADLTDGEVAQLTRLQSQPRRRTWLTARRALRRALASAGLPEDTSAYAFPHPRASLSYAGECAVAAAVGGDNRAVLGLGVDVENIPGPAPQTALLFLSEHEQQALTDLPAPRQRAELLRLWTAKEALYKSDPTQTGIDLRRYTLDLPLARHGVARLAGSDVAAFRYLSLDLPRGVLTVAVLLSQNGAITRD